MTSVEAAASWPLTRSVTLPVWDVTPADWADWKVTAPKTSAHTVVAAPDTPKTFVNRDMLLAPPK
ncbi:MAG: hypothetical protein AAFQ11_04130 [Pseudomonadota bacterium]